MILVVGGAAAALLLVLAPLTTDAANVTNSVVFAGNQNARGSACQSWWVPTVLEANGKLFAAGACKPADRNAPILAYMRWSENGGKTWSSQKQLSTFGQPVYSKSTGQVIMLVDPPATTSTWAGSPQTPPQCAAALSQYCPTLRAKKDSCLACLSAHPAKFFDGACTHSELSDYCDKTAPPCPKCPPPGPPPPPPPPPPKGQLLKPVFARELPQLTPQQLADPACQGGLIRTKDGMDSFFGHTLINVSNSLGPHYIGGGLNHGIEIQNGPHKGRLVLALRFDTACAHTPDYMRAYALFSDDQGLTWTAGQLLPAGWTEDQIAEMKNGSLLMTSRLESRGFPQFAPDPSNGTDPRNVRRGFARSDDGGYTWAQVWHLADRQPEISKYVAECAHALASSSDGTMWWAHPGGAGGDTNTHGRWNGTLQRSTNGGDTWEFAAHITRGVYPTDGYGYSDLQPLPDGSVAIVYQKTFSPPVRSIEGGGYDIGFARVTI